MLQNLNRLHTGFDIKDSCIKNSSVTCISFKLTRLSDVNLISYVKSKFFFAAASIGEAVYQMKLNGKKREVTFTFKVVNTFNDRQVKV